MGQVDLATKNFFGKKDIFADLMNNYFFQGRKVIQAKDLVDRDTESVLANFKPGKLKSKYRDLFKQVEIKADKRATYVLIGIENQTEVDYTMPIRVLLYDALAYEHQRVEAVALYKEAKDSFTNGRRFFNGLPQGTLFKPVITMVIYLGSGCWAGPRSLYDSLDRDIPQEFSRYVNNWQVPIIEPSKLSNRDLAGYATELGLVMKFLKYCHDKAKLLEEIRKDAGFTNVSGEALGVMNSVSRFQLRPLATTEEGGYNMCKAIDDLIKDSVAEGRAEQARETAVTLKNMGMAVDVIAKAVHVKEDVVKEWLACI